MSRNGKNNFYRTLNLDKDTRKLIRWYNELFVEMMKDPDIKKEDKLNEDKRTT